MSKKQPTEVVNCVNCGTRVQRRNVSRHLKLCQRIHGDTVDSVLSRTVKIAGLPTPCSSYSMSAETVNSCSDVVYDPQLSSDIPYDPEHPAIGYASERGESTTSSFQPRPDMQNELSDNVCQMANQAARLVLERHDAYDVCSLTQFLSRQYPCIPEEARLFLIAGVTAGAQKAAQMHFLCEAFGNSADASGRMLAASAKRSLASWNMGLRNEQVFLTNQETSISNCHVTSLDLPVSFEISSKEFEEIVASQDSHSTGQFKSPVYALSSDAGFVGELVTVPVPQSSVLNVDSTAGPVKVSSVLNAESTTDPVPVQASLVLNAESTTDPVPVQASSVLNVDSTADPVPVKESSVSNGESTASPDPVSPLVTTGSSSTTVSAASSWHGCNTDVLVSMSSSSQVAAATLNSATHNQAPDTRRVLLKIPRLEDEVELHMDAFELILSDDEEPLAVDLQEGKMKQVQDEDCRRKDREALLLKQKREQDDDRQKNDERLKKIQQREERERRKQEEVRRQKEREAALKQKKRAEDSERRKQEQRVKKEQQKEDEEYYRKKRQREEQQRKEDEDHFKKMREREMSKKREAAATRKDERDPDELRQKRPRN